MRFSILIIMSLLFCKVEAQNNTNKQNKGFHLEVTIPAQQNKTLYLGQYWKNKTYAIDSVKLSDKGKGTFSIAENLSQGQYFLHIKPSFQADFLIGDEQRDIKMYLDENTLSENKVTGSKDTGLLWEYLAKTDEYGAKINSLRSDITDSTLTESKRTELSAQIRELEVNQKDFETKFKKKNAQNWAGKLIRGLEPVILPYPKPQNQQEVAENKRYGKTYFFDNIDLADPRFWNTNYFDSYIDSYMKDWVDPIPDSLATAASRLVAKTKGNSVCFKEMLSKLFNKAIASKRMGDENIWARLFENYIQDKDITWIDAKQMGEIKSMYENIKNNRIGMTALNIPLKTIDGDSINTAEIVSDYIVLYFYDLNCGHCATETPKLHNELYEKYKDKGLEIIAINVGSNKIDWEDYIQKQNLTDWINAADMDYKSQYWLNYDLSGIPMTYLLDKNKKIIAKKIDTKQINTLLEYYIENNNGAY